MKTDLFRFATLRTPQLISTSKKKMGYIKHPDVSKSFFLEAIKNIDNLNNARKKIYEIYKNFNPTKSVDAMKNMDMKLYQFSDWLMSHKNVLTLEKVKEQNKNINELTLEKEALIWDNLLYQIATKDSEYIRQASIQLLIASNFIKKTKNEDEVALSATTIEVPKNPKAPKKERQLELYLRKLANAKLIIPSAFSLEKKDKRKDKYAPQEDYSEVTHNFARAYALHKVDKLESSKHELKTFNNSYKSDYALAFSKSEKAYEAEVENINNKIDAQAKLKSSEKDFGSLEKSKEKLNYPDFNFSFSKPLSKKYTQGKLSAFSTELIQDLNLNDIAVPKAIHLLDNEIKKQRKIAYQGKRTKKVLIANGNVIKGRRNRLYCYTIGIPREKRLVRFNDSIYIAINVGYDNAFIVGANYSLETSKKNHKSEKFEIIDNSNKSIVIKLFSDSKIPITKNEVFEFKGSLQLNNGVKLKLDSVGHGKNLHTNGCAEVLGDNLNAEELDIHFGVNRIGIADFRKVEQEVCCYVPGEVSHIENILAKEYKERHTRNLVSTESTTEVTSEVEIENLTDTSTTERNEINAETVNVLNEDRSNNFGFKAGVSGTYAGVTISADAYADFASSNSTSDSNTSAKTYAEDVTRRALERVVQKITQKRTSKIIKEFEENNRHGFDNRNGDKHVTGIYRWVDKIYTNRLVNYGKRLMYEFLIPEPAKFYRTAISTILETGEESSEVTTVIEVPPSPEELGFNGPSDINESNYQTFEAAYNVSLDPPIKEFDETTHSVSVAPRPDGDPFSFTITCQFCIRQSNNWWV